MRRETKRFLKLHLFLSLVKQQFFIMFIAIKHLHNLCYFSHSHIINMSAHSGDACYNFCFYSHLYSSEYFLYFIYKNVPCRNTLRCHFFQKLFSLGNLLQHAGSVFDLIPLLDFSYHSATFNFYS